MPFFGKTTYNESFQFVSMDKTKTAKPRDQEPIPRLGNLGFDTTNADEHAKMLRNPRVLASLTSR